MADRTPLGYPVLDSGSASLYTWTIPGTTVRLTMLRGNVGFVLACFVTWWARAIEPLILGRCGAHNKRRVTGGSSWSEHAGGNAADINWNKHPYGVPVSKTFTRIQAYRIRYKIKWWNRIAGAQVIRWGGDYRTDPDGMHVEMYDRLRNIKRLAAILKRTSIGREVIRANSTQARFL